ncbi:unannotated protein [freshwater metagenome]|uniref:Unannotated protein n=1 Tax=freshwater metagenome TaxID=449393 RepID=A0A6J7C038_9ZZZZ
MSEPPVGGFRHLGDRQIYQGHLWRVVVGEFAAPDGETFERDIVRSPGAVGVVPLYHDEHGQPRVLMVRQYRSPLDTWVLEIPAGMRDVPGEPTAVTAERELVEEVGMKAGRLEHLTDMYPASGMTDSVLTIYLATELTDVGREVHGPEETHMEVLDLSLGEAVEMVLRGDIHDSKTIIGLLMVERRLGLERS